MGKSEWIGPNKYAGWVLISICLFIAYASHVWYYDETMKLSIDLIIYIRENLATEFWDDFM